MEKEFEDYGNKIKREKIYVQNDSKMIISQKIL